MERVDNIGRRVSPSLACNLLPANRTMEIDLLSKYLNWHGGWIIFVCSSKSTPFLLHSTLCQRKLTYMVLALWLPVGFGQSVTLAENRVPEESDIPWLPSSWVISGCFLSIGSPNCCMQPAITASSLIIASFLCPFKWEIVWSPILLSHVLFLAHILCKWSPHY